MPAAFSITARTLRATGHIERLLGRLEGVAVKQAQPLLRKRNRVRSVHSSAAIEGNRLSAAQVTALLDGKRVVGAEREVREILNVNDAYERLASWKPSSLTSLLQAHGVLMRGLAADAGRLRTSGFGVFRGDTVRHRAPPAHLVHHHVTDLLRWVARDKTPTLIKGCVAHYELLFIHPFLDGNGRLSRLWQQVIHRQHSELLQFVPVESIIRARQRAYYERLHRADQAADCTPFIEFTLEALGQALEEFSREVRPEPQTASTRLEGVAAAFSRRWFTRADYLTLHPRLSTASASRDLARGVEEGRLEKRGDKRFTEYRAR